MPELYLKHNREIFDMPLSMMHVISDEATLHASPEGIEARFMDDSHVLLVDLNIPKSEFQKYVCEKEVSFAFAIEDIKRLLGKADMVELSLDGGVLTLSLEYANHSTVFNLRTFEPKPPSPLPKLAFDVELTIDRKLLRDIVNESAFFVGSIKFKAEGKSLTISSKGDKGGCESKLGEGTMYPIDINTKNDAEASYYLESIQDIIKAIEEDNLKISFKNKAPITFEVKIGETGKLVVYKAPYIER